MKPASTPRVKSRQTVRATGARRRHQIPGPDPLPSILAGRLSCLREAKANCSVPSTSRQNTQCYYSLPSTALLDPSCALALFQAFSTSHFHQTNHSHTPPRPSFATRVYYVQYYYYVRTGGNVRPFLPFPTRLDSSNVHNGSEYNATLKPVARQPFCTAPHPLARHYHSVPLHPLHRHAEAHTDAHSRPLPDPDAQFSAKTTSSRLYPPRAPPPPAPYQSPSFASPQKSVTTDRNHGLVSLLTSRSDLLSSIDAPTNHHTPRRTNLPPYE